MYIPFVRAIALRFPSLKALDLGCGRGEFIEVLEGCGVGCEGVDINKNMVAECINRGLHVTHGNIMQHLRTLSSQSRICISLIHVAEHISFSELRLIIEDIRRVLIPQGILIIETPNPENYNVGTCDFYIDPTHIKPIPPVQLLFLAEHYRFERTKLLRLNGDKEVLKGEVSFFDILDGVSPDYAIVSQKQLPKVEESGLDDEAAWLNSYGVSIYDLRCKVNNHDS